MFRSGSEVVDHASPDDNDDNLTPCVAVQHKRQHFDTKASSRKVTAVACLACQRRKSKCDGGRPTCGACHQRAAPCGYETADGLTRLADLKHKNGLLLSRVSDLERVFAKLRSEDDVEATETLARLRLGDEISQILGLVDEPRFNFGSAMTEQDSWRPSSPISQDSVQSPFTSTTYPTEQSYRNVPQSRATTASQQTRWIVPFTATKTAAQLESPTSVWFSDGDGHRRASASSAHTTTTLNPVLAHGTSGFLDPALQSDHESDRGRAFRSSQDTKPFDDKCRAGRIYDEKRHSRLANAINVLAPEQHMDMSLLMTNQAGTSISSKTFDGSIPIWAILPKHTYDQHPINAAISSFMFDKRSMISRGFSPDSFMGLTPALECLFDDKSFAAADDLSRWATRFGVTFFKFGMLQAVGVHLAWYLMRWMIMPTAETYQAIPSWLRPTPDQLLVPHTIATDFLHRPQFRDAVLRTTGMQENSDWIDELSNMVDCNWPHSIEAGLVRDGETGCLSLNPVLRNHIDNMDNWSISSKLRAFMPNAEMYFQLRHPEG